MESDSGMMIGFFGIGSMDGAVTFGLLVLIDDA